MSIHIIDDTQRLRRERPNRFGMNPLVAERMASLGQDPQTFAEACRDRYARHGGAYRTFGRRAPRPSDRRRTAVEAAIDYADVTTPTILDQSAAEVMDGDFYAEDLVPTAFVDSSQGQFPVDDYAQTILYVDDKVSPHGDVQQVHSNHTFVPFRTEPRALTQKVNRNVASQAPKLVSVAHETQKLAERSLRGREVRTGLLVGTATNFDATCRRVLGATQNWNGGSTADPIADMQAMIAAMLAFPNTSAFSLEAWQAVQINATLREILRSQLDNEGMLRPADWSLYWGIMRTIIAGVRYTLAGSSALNRIYPTTSFALLHVNPAPNGRGFAKRFAMRGGRMGWSTQAWFEPGPGGKGVDCVKVSADDDTVIIDGKFGAICTGMRA